ncbi:MAG: ferredoxin [Firmicutes bacterium]|nr:ferredoxin [Bacillota bacterium]
MARIPYVDIAECTACGTCEELCPGVFKLSEELGYATVVDPRGASEEEIQEAVDACPVGAIGWEEED